MKIKLSDLSLEETEKIDLNEYGSSELMALYDRLEKRIFEIEVGTDGSYTSEESSIICSCIRIQVSIKKIIINRLEDKPAMEKVEELKKKNEQLLHDKRLLINNIAIKSSLNYKDVCEKYEILYE